MRYEQLDQLYNICKKISCIDLGHTGKSYRSFILEDIVEKLLLHLKSMSIIFWENRKTKSRELDVSALATLARNIMDVTNNYYYFGERNISMDELKFRFYLSSYHDVNQSMLVYKKLNFKDGGFRWSIDKSYIKNIKTDIKNINIYKNLSSDEKKELYLGNRQKKKYHRKKIFSENIESACYNILSQSVHSFNGGLGNNSIKDINIMYGNYFDSLKLLFMSCEIAIIYTANVIDDYLALIKRLNKYLDSSEKKIIKELKSVEYFYKWLDLIKDEYDCDLYSNV